MKVYVISGPNLNFLGIRQTSIYGHTTYEQMVNIIQDYAYSKAVTVEFYQSNHEGVLVDMIQKAYYEKVDGIIINPAAYTHTSIALRDAIEAIKPIPVIEVHLSNIYERESFRHISYVQPVCIESYVGYGVQGYLMAIDKLLKG